MCVCSGARARFKHARRWRVRDWAVARWSACGSALLAVYKETVQSCSILTVSARAAALTQAAGDSSTRARAQAVQVLGVRRRGLPAALRFARLVFSA